MAKDAGRGSKTETLTIPTRPMNSFHARLRVEKLRGQPLTTVVERAIGEAADKAVFDASGKGEIGWQSILERSRGRAGAPDGGVSGFCIPIMRR